MPSTRRIFRGALWITSALFWGATFFLANAAVPAYLRYANKERYTDAVFYVTGAGVTGRYGSQPFLEGKVNGYSEIYVDSSAPKIPWPDYLKIFPVGTSIPVKFNPQMTGILLANQELRVLKHEWNFEEDAWLIQYYLRFFAAPSLVLGAALYLTRSKNGKVAAK